MSPNESHIDFLRNKDDDDNDPEIIALDIKDIPVVSNVVHGSKVLLDITQILPIGPFNNFVPVQQRNLCYSMLS